MKSIVHYFLLIFILTTSTKTFAQPGNDDCADALPITQLDGTCISYDFNGPTFDLINGSCAVPAGTNTWFTFTAQGGNATFNITGDPKLAITVLSMPTPCSVAGAIEMGCGFSTFTLNNLVAGDTYYVIVSNSGFIGTGFEMCVLNPPPPPNDDACTATGVAPNGCVTGTTLGADADYTVPGCPPGNVQNAVFFSYVLGPLTTGLDIAIANNGITGQMGAMLLEFPNGCTNAPFLASGNSVYCGPSTNTLSFDGLTPGSTVYLMIGSTTAGAGIITDMCFTEIEGDPPCAANVDCANAEVIPIPNPAEPVCVTGCNVGMPPGGFTNCNNAFLNPTAWYTFNTGPNNTAVFNFTGGDLTAGSFVLMTGCNVIVECNPQTITLLQNTDYQIAISDSEGNVGNFEMCITLLNITAPCIKSETFTITGASMGSPVEGPFKPCEVITFRYSTNFFSGGDCQWLHTFIPYMSECWNNQVPNLTVYPGGTNAGNMAWYGAGTVYWKPTTNNPPSAIGINGNGQLCLIGTAGCNVFTGGNGACGSTTGTPMPAGWVVTNASGTCGTNAPNQSWGIVQGCNTNSTKSLEFQMTVPCNACTSCEDDPEGFVIGIASFPDGATGGWNNPQCNGNGILKKTILVECCTPPTMVMVNGETCSDKTYFADITLDPPNSTLEWTVVNANGVLGASSGAGSTFSQTLTNTSNTSKVVTYSVIPISPTGCRGEAQLLYVTVLPAVIANAGPDKSSCPGATVTIGGNPTASGGAGAPYTILWNTGDVDPNIMVTPSLTTTYTVTVTDASGCQKIDEVTVTVSGTLEVNITPDPAEFCFSDRFNHSLTANVNGTNTPYTYSWVTPWGNPTSQTVTILAPFAGTFQILVEVTDAIGCIGIGQVNLTLNPDPFVLILDAPTAPLCPTENYQISSSPLYVDGTVFSSVPPGLITVDGIIQTSLMTPGVNYWMYATNIDPITGCKGKDSIQVKTLLLDDPIITPVGPFCANVSTNVQLVGTPAGGVWGGPVTPSGIFVPSTAGAGIHTITYLIGAGTCTKDTTFDIVVNPIPTPTILGLTPFCIAQSPDPILTSSIPGGTWSSPILADGTVPLSTMTPGNYPISYTVIVNGCQGVVNGSLIIADQPVASVAPEAIVCNVDPFMKDKSKIDLDNAVTGAANGTWKELTPLSGAVNLGGNEYDFLGVPTGTLATFVYTVAATAPCTAVTDTIVITVDEECDCPKLDFNQALPLCTNAGSLDLNSLKIKAGLGGWTLTSVPAGSDPATLTGSIFNATDADPGSYTVTYTLNPLPTEPDCPIDINLIIVVNQEVVYALTPSIKVCNNVPKPPSVKTVVNLDNMFIGQSVIGTWSNDDNVGLNTAGNTWDFTGVATGTYQFTFTPSGGVAPCANTPTTIDVIVTNECDCPNLAVLTPLTAICSNNTSVIDLNTKITSAVPGAWTIISTPAGNANTPLAGGLFDPAGKAVGTYTFRFEIGITPPEDCDSTVQVTVTISPELIYQLQPDASVCNIDPKNENDNQLNFSGPLVWASAVVGGTWADTDNSGATQNGNVWTFNGVPTGTYTFTFTPNVAQAPCPNTPQTIEITVVDNCACDDLPAIPALAAACNNAATINLIAPAGTTGTWSIKSKPAGINPAIISGNLLETLDKDQGTYIIRYLFNNILAGCPDSGFVTLVLSDYKSAGTSGPDLKYCENTVLIIDLLDEITGEEPGGTWTEVGPNTAGAALTGTILKITDLNPGNYIFEYKHAANGACPANSSEVNVMINANPVAEAGGGSELTCEKASAEIGGQSSSTGPNFAYSWTEKSNNPIPNPKSLTNTVTLEGVYYLTVTNTVTGCIAIDSVIITSDPNRPQGIVIERDGPTCFGFKDGYIRVTEIKGGLPPILYSLNGGPFTSVKSWSNLSGSNNTLQIKDANGCLLVLDNILLIEPTLVTVEMGNDTILNLGDTLLIDPVISIPEDSISSIVFSSDFDFITCTGCFDITVFPNQTTEYSVEVKDHNGCKDTDSKRVVVRKGVNIFIPNIFSPNGDGNNDNVMISTNDREIKSINSFQIYDRWGEKMFEAFNFQPNDPSQGWDGKLKGQKCNPAVYVYWAEVELFDGTRQIVKGDVTLVR